MMDIKILLFIGTLQSLQQTSAFFLWNPHPTAAPTVFQPPCDRVNEYLVLRQAISSQPCISNTQIWSLLEPVAKHQRECLGRAILEIAGYLGAALDHGQNCQCNGDFDKSHVGFVGGGQDHFRECLGNRNCKYLYEYFYLHIYERYGRSQCQTHHHVWEHLRDIHNAGIDLQGEMVLHLSQTFSSGQKDKCVCKFNQPPTPDSTTSSSTTFTSTRSASHTTLQSTQTSTILQSSTTMPAVTLSFPKCKKYDIVADIANVHSDSHPDARQCSSGSKTSHEAFVMVNCDAGSPHVWKKGASVISSCDTLPSYTPIAAIKNGSTDGQTEWELSGIFIECANGGFKMSYQDCGTAPTIAHIESGNGTGIHDPYNYFVIMNSM